MTEHETTLADGASGADSGEPDFAATLVELETLVERLESGELTLEASLGAFERGIRLTREARTRLDQAELRVSRLLENSDGNLETTPFAEDNAAGEGQ